MPEVGAPHSGPVCNRAESCGADEHTAAQVLQARHACHNRNNEQLWQASVAGALLPLGACLQGLLRVPTDVCQCLKNGSNFAVCHTALACWHSNWVLKSNDIQFVTPGTFRELPLSICYKRQEVT
jgi:hypothetical protein